MEQFTRIFTEGIESVLVRLRFSIVFGIGTIVLVYALLNIQTVDKIMAITVIPLIAAYFAVLTPIRRP